VTERTLTFYTRRGCPLCEEMAAALKMRIAGLAVRIDTIDIDRDPALKARFGWDVPLLFAGDREICRHHFNSAAFEAWLHPTLADGRPIR